MPKIEIKTEGIKGRILVDEKEVPGVRGYSIIHTAGSIPIVQLDLMGADLSIDGDGFIPALPEIFKEFYRPVEPMERFPAKAHQK